MNHFCNYTFSLVNVSVYAIIIIIIMRIRPYKTFADIAPIARTQGNFQLARRGVTFG